MNTTITDDEMGVLSLAEQYGAGLDLSGQRIGARVKAAARECARKGYLSGKPKSYSLTDAGRALLAQDRRTIHPAA